MEQLILCILVWVIVFLLIPASRIRDLGMAAVTAFFWMVFVDNVSTNLGFYRYQHSLLLIGQAPVFQNLLEAGLGILVLNWLTEHSLSKLLAVLLAGVGFILLHNYYIQRGVFAYGSFTNVLNFIHHIAALSVFTWLALAIVGERKVYSGIKTRGRTRKFA